MSDHSTYEALRQFADSWALAAMGLAFMVFVAWPFRSAARKRNDDAANMIFRDDHDGE